MTSWSILAKEVVMASRVSAAQAKAQLSELVSNVAHQGSHYIIERRGKPVAALVTVGELEELERMRPKAERSLGALALVGAWREAGDEWIDDMVATIYAERDRDTGRPVELDE
jgi:prevent-host-death family protein